MNVKLLFLLFFCPFAAAPQVSTPQRFDVLINEIMADPTPQVSLPDAEFVELKNISGHDIEITGWKLNTSASVSSAFPSFVLRKDSFLILCSTSNVAQWNVYGKTLGIPGFPSLPNENGTISLTSKESKTIHAVEYSKDMYNNPVKEGGGWSLEMIDPGNPCTGFSNWKASTDLRGGTPGRKNSVEDTNADVTPPQLVRSYSLDSVTAVLVFDEPLDSAAAATVTNYSMTGNSILVAKPQPPMFRNVVLQLSSPLQKRTVYEFVVHNITDCAGNVIGNFNNTPAGLAEEPLNKEIVINEILFNPKPNAYDYVELYNRSNKVVDAGRLYVGNRNSGAIGSLKKLSDSPYSIFPGEYLVVTENAASLKMNYLVKQPQKVFALSSLPSWPDDEGHIVLVGATGELIDEVAYDEHWHFALLSDVEGVSLERIDPDGESRNKMNWHSAAATAGYGTPGYRNSQYRQVDHFSASWSVKPEIFSPDNDGHDDVATIYLQLPETGYMANISIFDAAGRLVRYLVKNELLGLKNTWNWDGLGEKMQKLPIGRYVVFTEIFNLNGKKKYFKSSVVIIRKL